MIVSNCQWARIWSFQQRHTGFRPICYLNLPLQGVFSGVLSSVCAMEAVAENTWMFPGVWILEDLDQLVFIGHVLREANIPNDRSTFLITLGQLRNHVTWAQSASILPSHSFLRGQDLFSSNFHWFPLVPWISFSLTLMCLLSTIKAPQAPSRSYFLTAGYLPAEHFISWLYPVAFRRGSLQRVPQEPGSIT